MGQPVPLDDLPAGVGGMRVPEDDLPATPESWGRTLTRAPVYGVGQLAETAGAAGYFVKEALPETARGVIARGADALLPGFPGAVRTIAGALAPSAEQTLRAGRTLQEQNAPPPELAVDLTTPEGRARFAERPGQTLVSEGIPALISSAPSVVLGFATANPWIGGALAGAQEALPDYVRMREAGMSHEEATARMVATGVPIGVLNAIPLAAWLGRWKIAQGPIGRTAAGVIAEPLTEMAEEPVTAAAQAKDLESVLPDALEAAKQSVNVAPGALFTALVMGPLGSAARPGPAQVPDATPEARQQFRTQLEGATETPTQPQTAPEQTAAPEPAPAVSRRVPAEDLPVAPSNAQVTPTAEVPADVTPVPQQPADLTPPLPQQAAPAAATAVPETATAVPEQAQGRPGMPPIVDDMIGAAQQSTTQLRGEIKNVRMAPEANGWQFEFRGQQFTVRDNNESPVTESPNSEAFRSWILKQILANKHTPVAAPKRKPPKPKVVQSRIQTDAQLRDQLTRLRNEAGWAEQGGTSSFVDGKFVKRNHWIPRADWWLELPQETGLDYGEKQVRAIIDQALKGKKLTPKQTKLMDFLIQIADNRIQNRALFPEPEPLDQIWEPRNTDLFGYDADSQAALSKKQQRVDRKLGQGREAPKPEQAPRGDLFREAAERAAPKQADITDEGVKESGYKGRKVTVDDKQLTFGFEVRPGTTEAQVAKGNAFIGSLIAYRDRLRGATVLADGLTRDFVDRGYVSLVGQTANNANDLATLAQVYRDPRVETLHFIFTRGDKIVAQTATTQRLPGGVGWGKTEKALIDSIAKLRKAHGADGYWMLHNHPSGYPGASTQDMNVTRWFRKHVPGIKGHVIIDTNEYGVISVDGRDVTQEVQPLPGPAKYDPSLNPRRHHDWLGQRITSGMNLAALGIEAHGALQNDDRVILIATDVNNRIKAVTDFDIGAIAVPAEFGLGGGQRPITKTEKRQYWQVIARIRRFRAAAGASGHVFAVRKGKVGSELRAAYEAGILTDVVSSAGMLGSTLWSRKAPASTQALEGGRVREVAEQAPDYEPGSKVEVGGGKYTLNPNLGVSPEATRIILDVMQAEDARVAGERGGREPITWAQTGEEAKALLETSFGKTFESLINRIPRSTANAATLEAYAKLVNTAGKAVVTAAQKYHATRSVQDFERLTAAREQLGLTLAPFMGYRTEAGRALNVLRKIQGDFADADAIFEALGNGSEQAMREFAKRISEAKDVGEALSLTRKSYIPTLWDQYYEFWINSILSGPWTHAVNMTSNGLFNALEVGTELAVSLVSPNVSTRGALARFSGQLAGIQLGLQNAVKAFQTEQPQLTPQTQVEQGRQGAIPGKAGRIVRLPGRLLMAEDEAAKAVIFTGELYRLAMEEAVRRNPRNPHAEFPTVLAEAQGRQDWKDQAKAFADRGTFQTPLGPIGRHAMYVLNKTRIGRIIVPFVRTPTNILKRAMEYTPAAPLIQNTREDFKAGGRRRDIAAGRMVIGSSVMLGVMSLVAQGVITGAGPDNDNERELWRRTGKQPYSIKVGDKWVRYNRFEPLGMMLGVAADIAEIWRAMDKKEADEVASMVVTSLALNLGDKTFLRGIADFTQAYTDPKRYLSRWARNLAGSHVPNVAAQTARAIDPYMREARSLVDTFRARVPGGRAELPVRRDVAGEPIPRSAIEPLATTTARDDPLAQTLLALGVFKGRPGRKITLNKRTIELTGAEYQSLVEFVQGARWRRLTPMVESRTFRTLQRRRPLVAASELEKRYDAIGREARDEWLRRHPDVLRRLRGTPVNRPTPSAYSEARP